MTDSSALTDQPFMDALLNLVIPPNASGSLPGAGDLGISAAVIAGLQADPMLGPLAESGLRAIQAAALAEHPDGLAALTPEAGAKLVQAQVSANPFFMMGVLRYVYPAYYQTPQVLKGIGAPPRPLFPEGFAVEPTDPKLVEALEAMRSVG